MLITRCSARLLLVLGVTSCSGAQSPSGAGAGGSVVDQSGGNSGTSSRSANVGGNLAELGGAMPIGGSSGAVGIGGMTTTGQTASGGASIAVATGGTASNGGTATSTGGTSSTGGAIGTNGGASGETGTSTGGASTSGSGGFSAASGGLMATGGSRPTGGASATGGSTGLDSCMTSSASGSTGFGVTDGSSNLTVNSGAGLIFVVGKADGSITSINWRGTELNDASKGSHVASGLGTATVMYSVANGVALVTATAINAVASTGTVIQYMAVRQNENTIYMATTTTAEPDVGELRWITRLKGNILTGVPAASNNTGNNGNVESTDVFSHADGQTTSKYYGNERAKDLSIRGVTGTNIGVYMIYGSRETSSGGPFFRDIQNQSSTAADAELYNYMNSGHNQTEASRMGLHGPYALRFTTGCMPSVPDFAWMSSLNLSGWVSTRGAVVGSVSSGLDSRYGYLVGFANPTAQYWTPVTPGTGAFESSKMIPGTYAVTVYKGELPVWMGSANVVADTTSNLPPIGITDDPSASTALWRIGDWDGTPLEFTNGSNIGLMHPSDVRMNAWGPVTYVVGASTANTFPAVQFRGANTPTTVKFNLTANQVVAHTVRIGINSAYANGRPTLTVNAWNSTTPAASSQPDSRSITIGTYRGNNHVFTYNVPVSAFVTGANTMSIGVASGSSDLSSWLSASWSYDCVDML